MQHVLFQRDSALVRELVDEELAMVASYTEALERSESSYLRLILRDLLRSHARRIEMLREQLQALGGRFRTPDRASSRLAGDAATATGSHEIARDKAVVAGLVALEERLLERYHAIEPRLSLEIRRAFDDRIMTEQRYTHFAIRELGHDVSPQVGRDHAPSGPSPPSSRFASSQRASVSSARSRR